ncbi:MAG: stage III sporulation protein AB, partial [Oscillospiraceae bacterium]|nr:stage III sporulation protein AB [Oscillospiraceae bacterium]
MEHYEKSASRFDEATRLLPADIRGRARKLSIKDRARAEEIRLRVGKAPSVLLPEGELSLDGEKLRGNDIDDLVDIATRSSIHTARESLRQGFICAPGGFRIGLCGTAIVDKNGVTGFKYLSSAVIRISREVKNAATPVLNELTKHNAFPSTLLISPPGLGKTTLLRDMCRLLSSEKGLRIGLADERGEISSVKDGVAQFDVGDR